MAQWWHLSQVDIEPDLHKPYVTCRKKELRYRQHQQQRW